MKTQTLFTPGPTPIPDDVSAAMAQPLIHHRTQTFRDILGEAEGLLKKVFLTDRDVYVVSSSGTGAMEMAVVNLLSRGDEAIVIDGGKFGGRFATIATAYGVTCHVITVKWGQTVDVTAVRSLLAAKPAVKAVFATLCETSTGVCFPIKELAAIVSETPAVLVVDAISGLAADELRMDAWGVDVVISGSQKGLMVPPGLSFIAFSKKAWQLVLQATLPRFYFDARKYEKSLKTNDTPFTPATPLVVGLRTALNRIVTEGVEQVFMRHARLAAGTRAAITAMGLRLFATQPSNALSVACVPEGIDGSQVLRVLREELGIVMAGGQDHLKGKVIRLAHLGFQNDATMTRGIVALGDALKRSGYAGDCGGAVRAFEKASTAFATHRK